MKRRISLRILSTLLIISSLLLSACNPEGNPTNTSGESTTAATEETTAATEETTAAPIEETTEAPTTEATTNPQVEVTPAPQVDDPLVLDLDNHELIQLSTAEIMGGDDFTTDVFTLPADEYNADFIGTDGEYAYHLKSVMLQMSNNTQEIILLRIDEDGTEERLHEFDVQDGMLQIPTGYIYDDYFIYKAISDGISIMQLDFTTGEEKELISGNIGGLVIVGDALRVSLQDNPVDDTEFDVDKSVELHKYNIIEIDIETGEQRELATGYDAYLLYSSMYSTDDVLVYPSIGAESNVSSLIYESDDDEFTLELGKANISDAQANDDLIIWNTLTNSDEHRSSETYFYDIDEEQLYKLEGEFNSDSIQFAVTEDGFYFVSSHLSGGSFDTLYFYDHDDKTIAKVHELDTTHSIIPHLRVNSEGTAFIATHENDGSKLYCFSKD